MYLKNDNIQTGIRHHSVLRHLREDLHDAKLVLGVVEECCLQLGLGYVLFLGHDVDKSSVNLKIPLHAEGLHVLQGGLSSKRKN